jgi:hypothetical protein
VVVEEAEVMIMVPLVLLVVPVVVVEMMVLALTVVPQLSLLRLMVDMAIGVVT